MSRAVKTDHEFNPEKLAMLIEKAKGDRTQGEYAEQCHVSVSYISKYINMRLSAPPVPSTIKKLSSCAENDVSFEDLMDAAGYNPEKYTGKEKRTIKIKKKLYNTRELRWGVSVVSAILTLSDLDWKSISQEYRDSFEISIRIDKCEQLNKWYFKFISGFTVNSEILDCVYDLYGKLASTLYEPKIKVSIFTDSREAYDLIRGINPVKLPVYISVILIDRKNIKVFQEEYLDTELPLTDELRKKYTLFEQQIDIDSITTDLPDEYYENLECDIFIRP